jgi:hypothetical protein
VREEHARNTILPRYIQEALTSDPVLSQLPIIHVCELNGGVSHYIFECTLMDRTRLYIKKRDDHFSRLPQIKSNPKDIMYEKQILDVFSEIAPINFPHVVSFNEEHSYMILTDALPEGQNTKLENLFLEGLVTPELTYVLGKTLRKIHELTQTHTQDIRVPNDSSHYELKLYHRLGARNHPVLSRTVDQLRVLPNKRLILGDVAPKNIGFNSVNKNFVFFDMEEAHKGDAVFDYAYMLGHIIVHNLGYPRALFDQTHAYTVGYNESEFDNDLVMRIALGTVLYRLNSIIPYPLTLTLQERSFFESVIRNRILYESYSSWEKISVLLHS